MVVFPHAKINLGLNVLARRTDGYHDIETCFYPVPLTDILEVIPAENDSFNLSGLPVTGQADENLCIKAYKMLKDEYRLPAVSMHLHKVIPPGAGLGGGSSDAAFVLTTLNRLFELNLPSDQLKMFASKLGSDCPFFVDSFPALAKGTGTELYPFALDLSGLYIQIVFPGITVSTAEAYSLIHPSTPKISLKKALLLPLPDYQENIKNDFENCILPKYPEISEAKAMLIDAGALYASLSGSGSSVFGLFDQKPEKLQAKNGWKCFGMWLPVI